MSDTTVSFHEGGTSRCRTWVVIGSATSPRALAEHVAQVASGKQDLTRSTAAPKISVQWVDGRCHVSGEAGELKLLVPAVIKVLTETAIPT